LHQIRSFVMGHTVKYGRLPPRGQSVPILESGWLGEYDLFLIVDVQRRLDLV